MNYVTEFFPWSATEIVSRKGIHMYTLPLKTVFHFSYENPICLGPRIMFETLLASAVDSRETPGQSSHILEDMTTF